MMNTAKITVALVAAAASSCAASAAAAAHGVAAQLIGLPVGTDDHLLFDDHWTATRSNLTLQVRAGPQGRQSSHSDAAFPLSIFQKIVIYLLTKYSKRLLNDFISSTLQVHRPKKMGMVIEPEHPWEPIIFAYNSLVKVNETDYRVYYDAIGCTDPTCNKGNGHRLVCVALSVDGRNFHKPDLGLIEFNGSKHNNIVSFDGADGKDSGVTYTVFMDGNPSAKLGHKFVGFNDQVFVSADGFSFTLLSASHHLPFSDTQQAGFWDADAGAYRVFFRTHQPGTGMCAGAATERSIGMLTVGDWAAIC
jgi:hypothetical protein